MWAAWKSGSAVTVATHRVVGGGAVTSCPQASQNRSPACTTWLHTGQRVVLVTRVTSLTAGVGSSAVPHSSQ